MSLRDSIRTAILRSEVDSIDGGRAHIEALREREDEREAQRDALRSATSRHESVPRAAARRLRLIK